jgi:hypothetical protein
MWQQSLVRNLPARSSHIAEPKMMQQLPEMLMMQAAMKAPRRPSLSATTPPLTAPNMAPMTKIEANKLKESTSALNSGGRHRAAGCKEERGPDSPMEKPKERAPQATINVKRKVRVRVSGIMCTSPSTDGRGVVWGDMLYSCVSAIASGSFSVPSCH